MPADAEAKGTCDVFTVAEVHKQRERLIEHPIDVNRDKPELDNVTFLPTEQRHAAVHAGPCAADVDFSAHFDHFSLHASVRDFFCFRVGQERYRLRVLPMGLRHSVAIAHRATLQLMNFPMKCHAEAYIDNVRFVGAPQAVEEALAEFIVRCKRVGATLNEVENLSGIRDEDIRPVAAALLTDRHSWLGEDYNYTDKTVAVSQKTKDKIQAAVQIDRPTWRNFAALISLLRYASRTAGLRLSSYFPALRAFADASRLLAFAPDHWDKPALRPRPYVLESITQWVNDVLNSGPREVRLLGKPQYVLITDASRWGWGACLIDETGEVKWISRAWSIDDHAAGFTGTSSRAEPEAIYRAVCALLPLNFDGTLGVLTDSNNARYALSTGHSPSFELNRICSRLTAAFPKLRLLLRHIRGILNPVDGISRGHTELTADEWARVSAFAQELFDEAGTFVDSGGLSSGSIQPA